MEPLDTGSHTYGNKEQKIMKNQYNVAPMNMGFFSTDAGNPQDYKTIWKVEKCMGG